MSRLQPSDTRPIGDLSPSELAQRCAERKPDASHEPFCFELFRRAIVERCDLSWNKLYECYWRLVYSWVFQCMGHAGHIAGETAADLTTQAFAAFWRSYTPDKLARATTLGQVLAYLKSCAVSQVNMARRREQRRDREAEWDQLAVDVYVASSSQADSGVETAVLRRVAAEELWTLVERNCHDERELIVARLNFVAGMKPRKIVQRYPDHFSDVEEVYRVRKALRSRLGRNKTLKEL